MRSTSSTRRGREVPHAINRPERQPVDDDLASMFDFITEHAPDDLAAWVRDVRMSLLIKAGELAPTFAARCWECKRLACLEGAATKHGARSTLLNQQWDEHAQHGWICADCRTAGKKK